MTDREIRLHFEGPRTQGHTIPAQMLVRSLENVQRVIFLLAKYEQGDTLGQRARVSHELERTFALICKVPEDGGYALPQEIGDPSYSLFDEVAINQVAGKFAKLGRAIDMGDAAKVRELIPDTTYRSAILKSYKAAQPPKRSGLILSIEDYRKQPILSGRGALEKLSAIEAAGKTPELGETPAYLNGTLIRMDFVERSLSLKLFSGRTIQAFYNDDFEPVLLENARGLIQIHGNVQYNSSSEPASVADVDEVTELDLSDITVGSFEYVGQAYKIHPKLEFKIDFDEDSGILSTSGDFGIHVCAETRSMLEDEIDEATRMLWHEYALETEERLSPMAIALARGLKARISGEVTE